MARIPGEFVPLSTRYRRDRSIRRAGIMAEIVFVRSLALVKREETGGVIEDYDIAELTEDIPDPDAAIKALVDNQLWEQRTTHSWGIRSWKKWNPSDESSESGKYGNHIRWHVNEGITKEDCQWCAGVKRRPEQAPDVAPMIAPDSPPDIAPDVGSPIAPDSQVRVDLDKKLLSSSDEDEKPKPKPRTKNTYTEEFEKWWSHYPHKKGSKFEASKQFKEARKLADLETLIKTAIAYGKTTEKQYILHGDRWLKRRHWEDAAVIQLIRPENNPEPELPEFIPEMDMWDDNQHGKASQ